MSVFARTLAMALVDRHGFFGFYLKEMNYKTQAY